MSVCGISRSGKSDFIGIMAVAKCDDGTVASHHEHSGKLRLTTRTQTRIEERLAQWKGATQMARAVAVRAKKEEVKQALCIAVQRNVP